MSTLSCSLKYSSVNESVLHSHCRLKLLLACLYNFHLLLYRWAYGRSHLKANGFVLVMYTEGKGRKRNDVFVISWPYGPKKKNILHSKKNYVQGVKYVLPLYTYSVQHRQNLLHWRIGLWCSLTRMRVLLFDCMCRNRSVLTLFYVSFCAKCTCSGCDQMRTSVSV